MQTYNFPDHTRGDTLTARQFQVNINEAPLDLNGAVIKIQFRQNSKRGNLVKSCTVGQGITVADADGGVFVLDQFDLDWPEGTYFFDCEITKTGLKRTYFGGTIRLNQDVTV